MAITRIALALFVLVCAGIVLLDPASAARKFNGTSDTISIPGTSNAIDITGTQLSFACWFMMTSSPGSNDVAPCSKWAASNAGGYMLVYNCNAAACNGVNGSGKITAVIYISISLNHWHFNLCNVSINLNQWYVAVMTYENNLNFKVYLGTNGTMTLCGTDNTIGSTGTMVTSGNNLIIGGPHGACGGSNWSACTYFTGLVAETAVWNQFLTANEVNTLATVCPSAVRRTALVGYWPLPAAASPEPDLSGNQINGTVTGTSIANHPPCIVPQPNSQVQIGVGTGGAPVCGPPTYGCSSRATVNPGTISALFQSRAPTGTVNTAGTAVTWVSGDQFTSIPSNGQIFIAGTKYNISAVGSSTSITLTTSAGTQTGATYVSYTGCVGLFSQGTGSGCQNSTAYDTTINAQSVGDCYVRMNDGTSFPSGQSSASTSSGGDEDLSFDSSETYMAVSSSGGSMFVFQVAPDGNGCLKVVGPLGSPPVIKVGRPFFFDPRVANPGTFYVGSGSVVKKYVISSINVLPTPTTLFDFSNCPGVPASFWSGGGKVGGAMSMGVNGDVGALGTNGPQNTAIWTLVWDPTNGCAAANWQTGSAWAFCNTSCGSASALGTFPTTGNSCWGANPSGTAGGIHDGTIGFGGTYFKFSINPNPPWSQGLCAGNTNTDQHISWQPGTLNNTYANGGTSSTLFGYYVSHNPAGMTLTVSPQFNSPNIRPLSNLSNGFSIIAPTRNTTDIHQGWPHPLLDDSYPVVGATNSPTSIYADSCGNANLCPLFPNNLIIAWQVNVTSPPYSPWIVFGHTFACGPGGGPWQLCPDNIGDYFAGGNAIGFVSPSGKYFCFATSMLHAMGLDNNGKPRVDQVCVTLK